MNAVENDKPRSVMLTADAGNISLATINLAAAMAKAVNTRLRGLFVEDEDLLQVTRLPITREISLTTARERPTDLDQMQRALRSTANRFRRRLEEEAQALQISCSFDYVRGRVRELSLQPRTDVTFTVIGQRLAHLEPAGAQRAVYRILLIDDRSPHLRQALNAMLSRFAGRRVEITLVGDTTEAELMAAIEPDESMPAGTLSLVEADRDGLDGLIVNAGTMFDVAIVPRRETSATLDTILEHLRCPIILVA